MNIGYSTLNLQLSPDWILSLKAITKLPITITCRVALLGSEIKHQTESV